MPTTPTSAHAHRERPAVRGELALVEQEGARERLALLDAHQVGGVPEAPHDAVLALDPRVVVGRAAPHPVVEQALLAARDSIAIGSSASRAAATSAVPSAQASSLVNSTNWSSSSWARSSSRLSLEPAALGRDQDGLGAVDGAELAVDVVQVRAHRAGDSASSWAICL